MNGRHLRGQHGFDLIARFEAFDNRELEIDLAFGDFTAIRFAELVQKTRHQIHIRGPNRLHKQTHTRCFIGVLRSHSQATF
jgi:hypothetical protein